MLHQFITKESLNPNPVLEFLNFILSMYMKYKMLKLDVLKGHTRP